MAFFEAIAEPLEDEDRSDRLLDVETQLSWLRELGFADVDCFWKWRETAVLAGVKPVAEARATVAGPASASASDTVAESSTHRSALS